MAGSDDDLAGFVAASWLRGPRGLVPTTLWHGDAAVAERRDRTFRRQELVGAFHSPAGCSRSGQLETLPRADYVSGLAEIIKAGFIADPSS